MKGAEENLELLRTALSQAYPVTPLTSFDDLLRAVDVADQKRGGA